MKSTGASCESLVGTPMQHSPKDICGKEKVSSHLFYVTLRSKRQSHSSTGWMHGMLRPLNGEPPKVSSPAADYREANDASGKKH